MYVIFLFPDLRDLVCVQDLTHKLCEVLSAAAGCSPLPSSHDPPPDGSETQLGREMHEDFEVVEHSDLNTLEGKQHVSEIVLHMYMREPQLPRLQTAIRSIHIHFSIIAPVI